jgi:voltage-gated potassium channel
MNKEDRARLLERFERATELPLLILAVAIVPLLVLPAAVDLSEGARRAVVLTYWLIWAIFAVDLSIRTYLAEQRLRYLARHWYDVLIVVLPFLRPLRVLRSARAFRLLRLVRLLPFLVRGIVTARRMLERRGLQYVMLAGLGVIFLSAGLMVLFERGDEGVISDYGTGLWWAITTVSTVGYGDTFPVSPAGRGIAAFLMLVGIAFFSWLTANIAAFFVEQGSEEPSVTMDDIMAKLDSLERELRSLRAARSEAAAE